MKTAFLVVCIVLAVCLSAAMLLFIPAVYTPGLLPQQLFIA